MNIHSDSPTPLASANISHIHHNRLRNCCQDGFGYGLSLRESEALVEANDFQGNRHHIAAFGTRYDSYEARHNTFGPSEAHACDMHCDQSAQYLPAGTLPSLWSDGTAFAGGRVVIHHNTYSDATEVAIRIRGIPTVGCDVSCNWFQYDKDLLVLWQHRCPTGAAGVSTSYQNKPSVRIATTNNAMGRTTPTPADPKVYVHYFDAGNDAAKCRCCPN